MRKGKEKLLRLRNQQYIAPAAPGMGPSSVSQINIGSVKDLIRVYLQKGKNKDEVTAILSVQNGIHPAFTHLAWNRLKEERPELFNDYMEKIILRQMFNLQLDQQQHLLPAKSPPLARPNLGFSQQRLVDTLDGNLHIDSYRQFVNYENPASANFLPAQKNYGRGRMVTNSKAAHIPLPSLPPFQKPRISNVYGHEQQKQYHLSTTPEQVQALNDHCYQEVMYKQQLEQKKQEYPQSLQQSRDMNDGRFLTSFLYSENSFLTPWSWNPDPAPRTEENRRMKFRCGSFF